MKRKMEAYLEWWKDLGSERMPLLLYGARQVGKTHLLKAFGESHYQNTVYLNFETEPALAGLFADSIAPHTLVPKIEQYYRTTITPGSTLLIFDEIQLCNRALTACKYFCEEAPAYDLIGAGSLLGVHIAATDYSFPVGKVLTKTMHPMDFEEFLLASDKAVYADIIRDCFHTNAPMTELLHRLLLDLYREYLLVGGMPLAVLHYFNNNATLRYQDIQRIILDTYISDMTKYADKAQSIKTIQTYASIVPQLAKDNRKFQYKSVAKGARASLFGESIDWLIRAGAVLKCGKTQSGDTPPRITEDLSSFKLYMSDVGLSSHKAGLTAENMSVFDQIFMGGIVENYVAQALASNGHELYYWEAASKAEVDFVTMIDGDVIPIEVKAGEHTRSLSLSSYRKQYRPKYAIRISARNFGFDNGIKSVPLYAAHLV